ncbi:hypothetical protein [Proteus vulgaris]|uniref:hypothetical protein n=1 Tax=Proteus vulgaris TaxID=585 RepID=UPI0034D47755
MKKSVSGNVIDEILYPNSPGKNWLMDKVIFESHNLETIDLLDNDEYKNYPRGRALLVHYTRESEEIPDFKSERYHWTTYIGDLRDSVGKATGWSSQYLGLFFLKITFPHIEGEEKIRNGGFLPLFKVQEARLGYEWILNLNNPKSNFIYDEDEIKRKVGYIKLKTNDDNTHFILRD